MKKTEKKTTYFFVDESGDPTLYNRHGKLIIGEEGCSKILLLGFISTTQPKTIRQSLLSLQEEIKNDEYLKSIPSRRKSIIAFHAKDDCPEIREKVFKLIKTLDFKAEFIVARKIEGVFKKKHSGKQDSFYDYLVTKLFTNKLHVAENSIIYFAKRGSRKRQALLEEAISDAIKEFEKKWKHKNEANVTVFCQLPNVEPCLQVIDYMNWAVQRVFVRGEERYYKFVEGKISFLCDIYDFEKYPKNFYNKRNPFNHKKISPI